MNTVINVSVVIPAYNAERYLREALDSVLSQTYRPAEVLVIDDGSQDSTATIAESYGSPVRCVRKENGGVAMARNRGIQEARGEVIAFLDADDVWMPDKLKKQVALLAEHPEYAASYSDLAEVDSALRILEPSKLTKMGARPSSGWVFDRCVVSGFIWPSTALVRAQVFREIGGFNPEFVPQEDTDFFNRLTLRYQVGYVDAVTVMRRRHDTNLSNNFERTSLPQGIRVLQHAAAEYNLPAELKRRVEAKIAEHRVRLGRYYLGLLQTEAARAEFRAAASKLGAKGLLRVRPFWALTFLPKSLVILMKNQKDKLRRRRTNTAVQPA